MIINGDFDTYWASHLNQERYRDHATPAPDTPTPRPPATITARDRDQGSTVHQWGRTKTSGVFRGFGLLICYRRPEPAGESGVVFAMSNRSHPRGGIQVSLLKTDEPRRSRTQTRARAGIGRPTHGRTDGDTLSYLSTWLLVRTTKPGHRLA